MGWLWNFWIWCAIINFALLLAHDAIKNEWSKPRDYLLYVFWGPISLMLTIKSAFDRIVENWKQGKNKG